jgi:hypothetical protein
MSFVTKVIFDWGARCFGLDHMYDKKVRALRLLEEAAELCQSVDVSADQVRRCVDVVYGRPPGSAQQELGGVLVCAHAFAAGQGWQIDDVLEREVHRCLRKTPEHFKNRNDEKLALGLTGVA